MRGKAVAVGMCVAAALAIAGPTGQASAAAGHLTSQARGGEGPDETPASLRSRAGMITGVLRGTSGRPLAGGCVSAMLERGLVGGARPGGATGSITARTSAAGRYFFGALTAGTYSLRYHACGHSAGSAEATGEAVVGGGQLVRLAPVMLRGPRVPGAGSAGKGPAIPASAGITRAAEHRVSLASLRRRAPRSAEGGVSGRVTNTAGRPIKGLCALVNFQGGTLGVQTSAQGTYSTGKSLPAGQYTVQFGSCDPIRPPSGNWAPQWYRDKYSQARANIVTVRAGKLTRGIDAVMRRGGVISGVVTGKGGARLARVCVNLVTPDGKQYLAEAATVRGRYRIGALDPGRYRVYFDPACGYHATPYLGQWWPGASTLKASKTVKVRLGADTGHVNAALRVGGTIKGTVRFENSRGKRLAGICVFGSGLGAVSSVQPNAITSKNGTFVMEGLPAGRYQLSFGAEGCGNNGNYLYYNDPDPVRVRLGQTAQLAVYMKPGAIISGKVISAATGQPLAGICVSINDYFGDGSVTRSDGTFRIERIQPGRYSVGFFGGCGNKGSYAPQWFRDRTEPYNSARVRFRAGKLTSGIDAAMRPGSSISGKVSSKAGTPLGRICIGAYTPNEATYLFGVSGDFYNGQTRRGAYQISNLAPGQYQLVFFSCGSGAGWASTWYRSASRLANAGLLDVPAATSVTGINAAMTRGGGISGKVRGVTGKQYSFTCIVVTNLSSGASESTEADSFPSGLTVRYAIGGLSPGRYRVKFYDCGGDAATQWYSHKSTPGAANPVTVRARHVTRGIDAVLTKPAGGGGAISGRVTSRATGKPVPGICVTASSPAIYRSGHSDAHGDYTIRDLGSGDYQLYFSSCKGGRYALQVRPGEIRVQAPHVVRGVNFAMALAGSISGAVTSGSPTPAPRPGVCVTAVPLGKTAQPGDAVTGAGGAYALRGMDPGRYHVYFDPVGCIYGALLFAPQWYKGQETQSAATTVTVRAGAHKAHIDATLARDGTIAGSVTGSANAPLAGICVQATAAGAQAQAGRPVFTVSESGGYALPGLAPGRYLVSFTSGCGASGYAAQWWKNARSRTAATPVTVTSGSVTNGIDAAMHSSG